MTSRPFFNLYFSKGIVGSLCAGAGADWPEAVVPRNRAALNKQASTRIATAFVNLDMLSSPSEPTLNHIGSQTLAPAANSRNGGTIPCTDAPASRMVSFCGTRDDEEHARATWSKHWSGFKNHHPRNTLYFSGCPCLRSSRIPFGWPIAADSGTGGKRSAACHHRHRYWRRRGRRIRGGIGAAKPGVESFGDCRRLGQYPTSRKAGCAIFAGDWPDGYSHCRGNRKVSGQGQAEFFASQICGARPGSNVSRRGGFPVGTNPAAPR